MTKRWSSTRSDLTKTKRQASKEARGGHWVSDKEFWEDGIPDPNWTVVPTEPTDEMVDAGLRATAAFLDIPGSALTVNREKMRRRFRAMVAAAPNRGRDGVKLDEKK